MPVLTRNRVAAYFGAFFTVPKVALSSVGIAAQRFAKSLPPRHEKRAGQIRPALLSRQW
jgi:hypothetical protein